MKLLFFAVLLLFPNTAFIVTAVVEEERIRRGLKPFCGDGSCKGQESCETCEEDCGSCSAGGGGDDPSPAPVDAPTDAPVDAQSSCAQVNESCKGKSLCCEDEGLICQKKGSGTSICEATLAPVPVTPAPVDPPVDDIGYEYTGAGCDIQGPAPTAENLIMQFFAIGDTPYDEEAGTPFEGEEYDCLSTIILPGMMFLVDEVDFIAHIGDIKKGNGAGGDPYCTDAVFGSRSDLFGTVEPDIDFLLIVGDNEWNECADFDTNNNSDPVKTLWREYFATGATSPFAAFDRIPFPSGAAPNLLRQPGYPENFFFYYTNANVAFFGITEPAGDSFYNTINANWISVNLANLAEPPSAIVLFGHSNLSNDAVNALATYDSVPKLYIKGNSHPTQYCMEFRDSFFLEVTVSAFLASPLLVSLVQDGQENYFFHVEETSFSCP